MALFGAIVTLVGVVRGAVPHNGITAVVATPRVRRASAATWRWTRRNVLRRGRDLTARTVTGDGISVLGKSSTTATAIVMANPVTDPARFTAQIVEEFGRLQRELSESCREIQVERNQREQAVRDLEAATNRAMDGLVVQVRDLDLSGLRWQLVGVLFVVVGVVGDLLF